MPVPPEPERGKIAPRLREAHEKTEELARTMRESVRIALDNVARVEEMESASVALDVGAGEFERGAAPTGRRCGRGAWVSAAIAAVACAAAALYVSLARR